MIYAQPLQRITRLTESDLSNHDGVVSVRFGNTAVHLPEPLATHARTLLANTPRTRNAKIASEASWLFPGVDPGRPSTQTGLSRRLTRVGVKAGLIAERPSSNSPPRCQPHLSQISSVCIAALQRSGCRLSGRTWADYPANLRLDD